MEVFEVAFLLMIAVGGANGNAPPAFAPLGTFPSEDACTAAAANVRAALAKADGAAEPFCVSVDALRALMPSR